MPDPPLQPPSETMGSPQEPTAISPLFNDAEADTTFKSSDNVVFKVHSRHLKTASAVLSPGPVSMDLRETVSLPETSDVLEILFQFIDPPSEATGYRQPSVIKMKPILFFRVAEAAEKYAVFGAMNVCLTWMYHIVEDHPLRILNHSGKHGYTELADIAAEISVRCSLADAGRQLTHPGVLGKWLVYYNHWNWPREMLLNDSRSCLVLQLWRSEIFCALAKNPKSIKSLPPRPTIVSCNGERKIYNSNGGYRLEPCPCNSGPTYPWLTKLSEQRAAIPKFSSITLVE